MNETLIKTDKLSKVYKLTAEEIGAVREVDIEIISGDFVAIMGPSGSGKTTLLDSIGCLTSITSGTLEVLGDNVSNRSEDELVNTRRGNFGFIFQEFHLIPSLTAVENVELPLVFARMKANRAKAVGLLEKVGLGHRLNHLPRQLSGGERQRVAIARALITSPKVLIADEPTGNLDTKSSKEIYNIFKELNKEGGLTIIVATHDQRLGSKADRVIYLKDGRCVSSDEANEI
jgi:ABC-type lipoprotein export system ATPase subunit